MEHPTEQGSRLTINGLEEAASKPDVDPCDVACEAMPARVVGDLSDHDVSWLLEHTDDCNYCANELKRYDRLGEALTAVGAIDAETCEPPPVTLPRRDRVWYTRIDSPIGELILAATPEGLREIEFGSHVSESDFVARQRERGVEPVRLERIENAAPEVQAILRRAASELNEYFGGQRARFDVPLDWGEHGPLSTRGARGDGNGAFRPRRDLRGHRAQDRQARGDARGWQCPRPKPHPGDRALPPRDPL